MKRLFLLSFLPFLLSAQPTSKKIKVLFLGNSYTFVNNLPQLIKEVALSQGDTLIYDSNLPGGYTLSNHFYDVTSLAKISAGSWDYVVVQAQSQEPAFSPAQVGTQTLPYAIKLDSLISHFNPCANTVFYETWGRKNGDVANCPFYPPICTYTGMQNRLRDSYKMFADTVHDLLAPVGEAFRQVISTHSLINLYQSDESHPSLEGTYLAAGVFYETLFQKSVLTNTYNPGIGITNFSILTQAAHQTVSDSIDVWNISKYIPKAQFSYTAQTSSSFQFQAAPTPFLYKWSFGDGTTSILPNPNHTYTVTGTYTVSLVVYDFTSCKKDSVVQIVNSVSTTGLNEVEHLSNLLIYPNPCNNRLQIELPYQKLHEARRICIYDEYGKKVFEQTAISVLDVSEWKDGIYFIQIQFHEKILCSKFVKKN